LEKGQSILKINNEVDSTKLNFKIEEKKLFNYSDLQIFNEIMSEINKITDLIGLSRHFLNSVNSSISGLIMDHIIKNNENKGSLTDPFDSPQNPTSNTQYNPDNDGINYNTPNGLLNTTVGTGNSLSDIKQIFGFLNLNDGNISQISVTMDNIKSKIDTLLVMSDSISPGLSNVK
jgi:hypothetical protein